MNDENPLWRDSDLSREALIKRVMVLEAQKKCMLWELERLRKFAKGKRF